MNLDLLSLHLAGIGQLPKPEHRRDGWVGTDPREAQKGSRPVWFEQAYWETPIYERSALRAGNRLTGPAVVEQTDSTLIILPGTEARVDGCGSIVVNG